MFSTVLDIKTVLNDTLMFVRVCMALQEEFDFGVWLEQAQQFIFEVYPASL